MNCAHFNSRAGSRAPPDTEYDTLLQCPNTSVRRETWRRSPKRIHVGHFIAYCGTCFPPIDNKLCTQVKFHILISYLLRAIAAGYIFYVFPPTVLVFSLTAPRLPSLSPRSIRPALSRRVCACVAFACTHPASIPLKCSHIVLFSYGVPHCKSGNGKVYIVSIN